MFLATSAGNNGGKTGDLLPRRIETATVVAASDRTDTRWLASGTSSGVDLYAPPTA